MLIQCRECGGQVSSQAATCPQCGAPTGKGPAGTRTVEQTAKRWKGLTLIGGLLLAGGLVVLILDLMTSGAMGNLTPYAILAIIIGGGAYAIARVCAWWYHG